MSVHDFEVVLGLEVHCQLDTSSKMFTSCPFHFGIWWTYGLFLPCL